MTTRVGFGARKPICSFAGDTLRLWFRLLDRPVMATCPGLIHVEAWHGTFRSQDTLPHIATLFVGPPPSSAARATADAPIASTRILVRERTHLGDSLLRHARRGHPEAIPATLRGPLAMFASSRAATTFSCEHIDDSEQPRVRFECQREPGESGRWEAFTMAATGEVHLLSSVVAAASGWTGFHLQAHPRQPQRFLRLGASVSLYARPRSLGVARLHMCREDPAGRFRPHDSRSYACPCHCLHACGLPARSSAARTRNAA